MYLFRVVKLRFTFLLYPYTGMVRRTPYCFFYCRPNPLYKKENLLCLIFELPSRAIHNILYLCRQRIFCG